jgi:hypothetical protein
MATRPTATSTTGRSVKRAIMRGQPHWVGAPFQGRLRAIAVGSIEQAERSTACRARRRERQLR